MFNAVVAVQETTLPFACIIFIPKHMRR